MNMLFFTLCAPDAFCSLHSPTSTRTFHAERPVVGSNGPAEREHSCPLASTLVSVLPSFEMVAHSLLRQPLQPARNGLGKHRLKHCAQALGSLTGHAHCRWEVASCKDLLCSDEHDFLTAFRHWSEHSDRHEAEQRTKRGK